MISPAQMTSMLGVYLVAAELTSRDFIVASAPSGAPGVDIMVADQHCQKAWTVQVRTNRKSAGAWQLDARTDNIEADSHVYVFANLKGDQRPYYYVVPSRIVAGHQRVTPDGHSFSRAAAEEYRENWVLFGPPR